MQEIDTTKELLFARMATTDVPREILKAPELKALYGRIPTIPPEERGEFGKRLNALKQQLEREVIRHEQLQASQPVVSLDVTAPWDVNTPEAHRPQLLPTEQGTTHPLMTELKVVADIFTRMGFEAIESRQLDSDWNMFGALNFPEGHPARDGYDTFRTDDGFVAPAHTSTMQNRILRSGKDSLEAGGRIAAVSYGRVFRNEDVDPTHEHTFYQAEGVYVAKDASLNQMIAVLGSFFEVYYGQSLKIKTQPGYFPFVEPGLEFLIEKPAALGGKPGEWLEMLGCGMIHPNVLKAAGIDPHAYRGFAWGGGVDRLVMLKYGIEDVRHFEAGKLAFLRKFI